MAERRNRDGSGQRSGIWVALLYGRDSGSQRRAAAWLVDGGARGSSSDVRGAAYDGGRLRCVAEEGTTREAV